MSSAQTCHVSCVTSPVAHCSNLSRVWRHPSLPWGSFLWPLKEDWGTHTYSSEARSCSSSLGCSSIMHPRCNAQGHVLNTTWTWPKEALPWPWSLHTSVTLQRHTPARHCPTFAMTTIVQTLLAEQSTSVLHCAHQGHSQVPESTTFYTTTHEQDSIHMSHFLISTVFVLPVLITSNSKLK